MKFSEQLKVARAAAGLSQSQAALPLIAAGILGSVRTLQNWEAGRGETLPAYKQAAALAALRSPKRSRKAKGQNVSRQRPLPAETDSENHNQRDSG
jgi:transcriptional regulator with XRE-family HTH domain